MKGDRDPGYGSTSKMIAEAAVCLLQDAATTPGGIWTTAPALGDKLIARLQANAGLTFAGRSLSAGQTRAFVGACLLRVGIGLATCRAAAHNAGPHHLPLLMNAQLTPAICPWPFWSSWCGAELRGHQGRGG